MDKTIKRICTICARGGSKGGKGKNVRSLLGVPLIAYTIKQAQGAGLFDMIAVSSDSDLILETAQAYGVECLIKRPDEMATDHAGKMQAIRHCVTEVERTTGVEFEMMTDLDATSPLRTIDDVKNAVALMDSSLSGNLITAMPARRSPYFNLVERGTNGGVTLSKPPTNQVLRRQDAPECFDMNASIYIWRRQSFFEKDTIFNDDTQLYVMPEERSIDIDCELDFQFVEFMMSRRKQV